MRVALSYAVIAWLLLQIGDVVLEPVGAPEWSMSVLIVVVLVGFPVALVLAWLFELTPEGIEFDDAKTGQERPRVSGIRRYADVILIAALTVTVAVLLSREFGWITERSEASPVVAVLPFRGLGRGADGDLGLGLADTLTLKLGEVNQLIVLSPNSTFQYADTTLEPGEIGEELGATAILQGSLQRSGDALRINAQLTDVETGRSLWSASFDRDVSDFFAIQDEIATRVTRELSIALTREQKQRIASRGTTELSAQEARALAAQKLSTRQYSELLEAVELMREAIETDPEYALAHATLSHALLLALFHSHGALNAEGVLGEARSSAAMAQALDPQLGEAYFAQAFVADVENNVVDPRTWSEEHIVALLRRARQLSPNNSEIARHLANRVASPQERIKLLREAALLDPRAPLVRWQIARLYAEQGEHVQAIDWFLSAARSVEPYFAHGYAGITRMFLIDLARPDEAARWALAFRNAFPGEFRAHGDLLAALIQLGAWGEVIAAMDRFAEVPEDAGGFVHQVRTARTVQMHLARGDIALAAETTHRFAAEQFRRDPNFPDLSDSPYFADALTVMALADAREGHAQQALERFSHHYPRTDVLSDIPANTVLFPPMVMFAALHKRVGHEGRAREMLTAFLEVTADDPWIGAARGSGFTRFTVHALLGRTDEAIAALEKAADSGWVQHWNFLASGDFDPDYAAVVADPRFQVVYRKIEQRVAEMRASFRENPDIPPQYRID